MHPNHAARPHSTPALLNRRFGFATNLVANPTYTCIMAGTWAGYAYDEFVGDPSNSTQASAFRRRFMLLPACQHVRDGTSERG
jgi:hypothetical protein